MGNPLWAPWRMDYILSPKGHAECIFCGIPGASRGDGQRRTPSAPDADGDRGANAALHADGERGDEVEAERRARLVVASTRRAFVMLNKYPFAAGHLLVVPHAHVAALDALDLADHEALFRLVRESAKRLRAAVKCEGMNIGLNLGTTAGAGVAEHLHVHIVPRWSGDTNFMPVLADTRVVPQALEATREHLLRFFADLPASSVDGEAA